MARDYPNLKSLPQALRVVVGYACGMGLLSMAFMMIDRALAGPHQASGSGLALRIAVAACYAAVAEIMFLLLVVPVLCDDLPGVVRRGAVGLAAGATAVAIAVACWYAAT